MMTIVALTGIDLSPIEGFNTEKTEALIPSELSNNTDKFGVAYILAFAHGAEEGTLKQRRPMEEVVSWFE